MVAESAVGRTFFSYSRADSAFVLKLASDLRAAGAAVWIDQLDIRGGDRWDLAIEHALGEAPALVVVLSPAAVASNNVNDEVALAFDEGKRIVPVLHQPCTVPFRLRRLQHIDFTGDYSQALERLVRALSATGVDVPQAASGVPAPASRIAAAPARLADPAPAPPAVRPLAAVAATADAASPDRRAWVLVAGVVALGAAAGAWWWSGRAATPVPAPAAAAVPSPPTAPAAPGPAPTPPSVVAAPAPAPAPVGQPGAGRPRIFLHLVGEGDREALAPLREVLRTHGYEVPDIRMAGAAATRGDVRFFYPQDRATAERLKATIEAELARRGSPLKLGLLERDGSRIAGTAPNKLEVYLPAPARAAPN